jgi:hypothetical protein
MKAILALATLIFIVFGAEARNPQESLSMESVFNMNQYGKINATYLNALDMKIFSTRVKFEQELNMLGDTTDHMEGKIRAHLINMIEAELNDVIKERSTLDNDNDIIDTDVEPIYEKIEKIERLISEINV